MKKVFACYVFLVGLHCIAFCGQTSKIVLTDGSVIDAEVISLANGTYTLFSSSLGNIKVDASKIIKIEAADTGAMPTQATAPLSDEAMKFKMNSLSATMASDPDIMKTIAGLALDPQFQELLKDPEIVNAIQAGDMQTLMSNQEFMQLIHHPKIEEIKGRLDEKDN